MASSGNFCTWSPYFGIKDDGSKGITLSNGNLKATHTHNGIATLGTMAVKSGKWYWEVHYSASSDFSDGHLICGWQSLKKNVDFAYIRQQPGAGAGAPDRYTWGSHLMNYKGAGTAAYQGGYLSSYNDVNNDTYDGAYNLGLRVGTAGKILQYAGDFDNNKLYFGIDNTWYSLANSGTGTDGANTDSGTFNATYGWSIESTWQGHHWTPAIWFSGASSGSIGIGNWGQDSSFAGTKSTGTASAADGNGFGDFYYAPPTGFLALSSANLPISTGIDPNLTDDDYPGKLFNAVTYTGNGGTNAITGMGFKPDLIMGKVTSHASNAYMVDSSRGANKPLFLTIADQEATSADISTFDSDGFTLTGTGTYDANFNQNTYTYVAYGWRANGGTTSTNTDGTVASTVQANTAGGFSIVTYTGTGTAMTVGHGLDEEPQCVMVKDRDATANWILYTKVIDGSLDYGFPNTTTSFGASGLTGPNSTIFNFSSSSTYSNTSTRDYVMYCWHSVEGYSKIGIYTGNAQNDGAMVHTGFRPRMVVMFRTQSPGTPHWAVHDTARSTYNRMDKIWQWDTHDAQYGTGTRSIDVYGNGFKIKTNDGDLNAQVVMWYMAFGDQPHKYSNSF